MIRKLKDGETYYSVTTGSNIVNDFKEDIWVDENNYLHNENNKPALIEYFDKESNIIRMMKYMDHGIYHNLYGFDFIIYREDRMIQYKSYSIYGKAFNKKYWLEEREKILLDQHRKELLEELD